MRSKKALIRAIPVRVKPVTAAVATALGSLAGQNIAIAAELPDELVVTATRRDSTVQEVPYSMSAIGGDTLRNLNITNLSGIARYSAGLSQVDQGARDGNLLIIRGLSADPINSPEFLNNDNDRVSTYFGETPIYINLLPIDVQRVEVLRGPQGTIYGARSLSGTVRITPNKPDATKQTIDVHVGTNATSESDDYTKDADIVVNTPLIQDTLALRALLGYKNEAGYIDYKYVLPNPGFSCVEPGWTTGCSDDGFLNEEDANFVRTRSFGLSMLWTPIDDLDVTLSWRQQDRTTGARNINSRDALMNIETVRGINLDTGKYVSGLRYTEPNNRQNDIYNVEVVWDNPLGELVSSTSVTTYKADGRRDQTDFLLDEFGQYYEEFPDFSAFTREVYDDRVVTQEVRLVSDNDGPVNYLVGAWYQDSDYFVRSSEFQPFAGSAPLSFDTKTFDDRKETAVFGELGLDVTDSLNLLVGARWFDYEAKFRDCFTLGGDVDDPANCTPNTGRESESDDDVLGKFTASFQLADNMLTYFTFAQGYSTGKVNNGDTPSTPRYVEPETTDNYEIGLKGNWFDDRLRVNAALYRIDWEDIQVVGADATTFVRVARNLGEADSKGLELDVEAQLTDNLLLAAGYAYTEAEFNSGCTELVVQQGLDPLDPFSRQDICGSGNEDVEDGDRLPGSPENQGYLRATWSTTLNSGADFRATYGMTVQSDVLTKTGIGDDDCCRDNGQKLGGFALHNASATLDTGTVQTTLYVDNLLNKYAVTGVREDASNVGTTGTQDVTIRRYFENVIRPRTVGIDFRFKIK